MPARNSAVYSHSGITFAICCKAAASLSLTLPCASVEMFLSCSLGLAVGLCLCWQEAGAGVGVISPVWLWCQQSKKSSLKKEFQQAGDFVLLWIFKLFVFPFFFVFFVVVSHLWCVVMFIPAVIIAGKLTAVPLGNPFLKSSWCGCPFHPLIFCL